MMTKTEAYIRASRFYLSEELPQDFESLDEEDVVTFIHENVWEPFDLWDSYDVLELIDDLACEFLDISSSKN